jgi:hypothetical protein
MNQIPDEQPLDSLAAARDVPDGVVVLEGDWGGQIYVVAPAGRVRCGEATLERLLRALDAIAWPDNDPGGASVRFERLPAGASVPGGMGGGIVGEDVWVHPELAAYAEGIAGVLDGSRDALTRET